MCMHPSSGFYNPRKAHYAINLDWFDSLSLKRLFNVRAVLPILAISEESPEYSEEIPADNFRLPALPILPTTTVVVL